VDAFDGGDRQVDRRATGRSRSRLPAVPQLDAVENVSGFGAAEQRQSDERTSEGTALQHEKSVCRTHRGMVRRQRSVLAWVDWLFKPALAK